MNHPSYSPVVKHFAWLWWSPTASEALSYRLNLYRSMPPDLPRTLCIICLRKKFGALRALHSRTNPTLYLSPAPPPPPPPLLQPLGPSLIALVSPYLTTKLILFSISTGPPGSNNDTEVNEYYERILADVASDSQICFRNYWNRIGCPLVRKLVLSSVVLLFNLYSQECIRTGG